MIQSKRRTGEALSIWADGYLKFSAGSADQACLTGRVTRQGYKGRAG